MCVSTRKPLSVQSRAALAYLAWYYYDKNPEEAAQRAERLAALFVLCYRRAVDTAEYTAALAALAVLRFLCTTLQVALGAPPPAVWRNRRRDTRLAYLRRPQLPAPSPLDDILLDTVVGPDIGEALQPAAAPPVHTDLDVPADVWDAPEFDGRWTLAVLQPVAAETVHKPATIALDSAEQAQPTESPSQPAALAIRQRRNGKPHPRRPSPATIRTPKPKTDGATDGKVAQARALIASGQSQRAAARAVGLSESTLRSALRRAK